MRKTLVYLFYKENDMIKIVFVCLGNICRSPMAESVFTHLVNEKNLSQHFIIDSAATSNWESGNPIYPGTINVLKKHHIPIKETYSRQLNTADLDADYIITMDQNNYTNVMNFVKNKSIEINKLLHYTHSEKDIADPWYTQDFDTTYTEVYEGCHALLEYLIKKHELI